MTFPAARLIAAAAFSLLLAACGGSTSPDPADPAGGSNSSSNSSDPASRSWSGSAAPSDVHLVSGSQAFVRTVDSRQVLYVIPDPAPTSPTPLMIVLDYLGGNPAFMADLIYAAQHAAKGEVLAFPAQSGLTWNNGFIWNGDPTTDINFLSDMIADATKNLPVNANQISMTGYSEGGFMANLFACTKPNLISGYGMVGASQLTTTKCETGTPLKMIDISGSEDHEAPYAGFGSVEPALTDLTIWDGIDGCSGSIVDTNLPTTVNDGTSIVTHQIPGCDAIVYEVVGGGHDWPGAEVTTSTALLGKTSGNLDATEVQWDFFAGS